MRFLLLILIAFFGTMLRITAQEYSYSHYDTKEGLAGAVVYSIAQCSEKTRYAALTGAGTLPVAIPGRRGTK